jgi:hypothetical protein
LVNECWGECLGLLESERWHRNPVAETTNQMFQTDVAVLVNLVLQNNPNKAAAARVERKQPLTMPVRDEQSERSQLWLRDRLLPCTQTVYVQQLPSY